MPAEFRLISEASDYASVLPSSIEVPQPPRFTFGAPPASVMSTYFRSTYLHGIGIYAADGLVWRNGFIADASGTLLIGGEIQIHPGHVEALPASTREMFVSAPIHRVQGKAAAIVPHGDAYRIDGHWLVDILPKLAVLQAAGEDLAALHYPIPQDTPAFARELLTFFGVPPDRIVPVTTGHRFVADRLMIPTLLHRGVRVSSLMSDAARMFQDRLKATGHWLAPAKGESRIFVARRGRNRALTNRSKIEELAKEFGFKIVYPEDRPLAGQFALFAGAREILGEYGSAFHSSLFSEPGTVVCALRGDQVHPGFIQSGLGFVLKQPTGYVFGASDGDDYAFAMNEDAVRDCLRIVFDKNNGLARSALHDLPQPASVPVPVPTPSIQAPAIIETPKPSGSFFRRLFSKYAAVKEHRSVVQIPPNVDATIFVHAHLQTRGDTESTPDGWVGVPGSKLAIEGVTVSIEPRDWSDHLTCQLVRRDGSLSEPVRAGLYCGTRGQNAPVHGILLRADGPLMTDYSILVEACFLDGSRSGPIPAGTIVQSKSGAALEALRIVLVRGGRPPGLHTLLRPA